MKARRIVIGGAAALAACGVLAMAPAAVQASSVSAATWTKQHPGIRPPVRSYAAMAYDAATGTVVLFGGEGPNGQVLGDTWTWDGTTWTEQHPAVHPPARWDAVMAYDAATGTAVLFGGHRETGNPNGWLGDTWTWDGTTWAKQHPAASPPRRYDAAMAYDAATGTVVLFGGIGIQLDEHYLGDTWTWDGATWTKQHPAASPPGRYGTAMAYDAATSSVVLFGGFGDPNPNNHVLDDTWTWDGTTWAQEAPAASPVRRWGSMMAYDAASSTAVLFGGFGGVGPNGHFLDDTWTWDGTTWTKQATAVHPPARNYGSMAYDAATGSVVLFGGDGRADTWTWG